MDEWVAIEGYRWPYRINRKGCVQKKMEDGSWYTLKPYTSGRSRVAVKLRSTDNRKIDVPVVWLMADAFMGGRRPGYGMPEGKPWMNCLFEASGQLPGRLWPGAQVLEISPGKYGLLGPDAPVRPAVRENRFQDSAMHKWLATEFFEKFGKEIRNDLLKEVSKDEGNHDPAALGDTHCLSGWERTAAQSRGDKGVEDELPGAAGDPCGEDRA